MFSAPPPPPPHEEEQYLNLIRKIVKDGFFENTRNGNTLYTFGYNMRFSLRDGTIPFITTKKFAWKTCFRELMWFVRGSTDAHELAREGVHIWDGNSTREYLDSRGLYHLNDGDIGPGYGHQWRHFGAPYRGCNADYTGQGIDQLAQIIAALKDPAQHSSRRLVLTAWNPTQLDEMALPPCHILVQFNVAGGKKLSCSLYQRSGDVGLGVPFNIASYSFLTHLLAHHCGLEADEFIYTLGNAHIYEPHLKPLMKQSVLRPRPFPRIRFSRARENIEEYNLDDIEFLQKYEHEPVNIKMDMIV